MKNLFTRLIDRLRLTQPYQLGSEICLEVQHTLEVHALDCLILQAYRRKWNTEILQFQYQALDAELIRCLDQVYEGIGRGGSSYVQMDPRDRILVNGRLTQVQFQISRRLRLEIEELTR